MWDEIQDMPGEIFDISDETRDEMAAAWADDDILDSIAELAQGGHRSPLSCLYTDQVNHTHR
jgi:hypothetical protein